MDTRIFMSNLIETEGFSPIVPDDMETGLLKALKRYPDLIILDMPMADKKGIQIYQDLKQNNAYKNIPVMMISLLDKKTIQQYQQAIKGYSADPMGRPSAFLKKPLEADEFLALVRQFVAVKNRRDGYK